MKQPSIISILTFLYFITSSIMATNWKLLETNYAKVYYPATHKQLAIETAYYLEKNRNYDLFFLMGADNLINFHKWYKWKNILKKTKIIVFDRHGYKKKSLNSKTFKTQNTKQLTFVEFKKVNISSSQLRKI